MSSSSQFKPPCPSCQAGIGRANTVGITGEERTVTYSCAQCGHTWKETDYVPMTVTATEPEHEAT